MAKRLIGIDLDATTLRVAILRREQNRLSVEALVEKQGGEREAQLDWLQQTLGEVAFGDRLATCLPASSAYLRQLDFPFDDARKIEAALGYELGSQIPVPLEGCVTAHYRGEKTAEGTKVTAVALPEEQLAHLLPQFDERGLPLQVVDLAPYAWVTGLAERLDDGLLVILREQETLMTRVIAGQIDYVRATPGIPDGDPLKLAASLVREIRSSQRRDMAPLPIYLAGVGATSALAEALEQLGQPAELLVIETAGRRIAPAELPAVALALRAGATGAVRSFNFRKGDYALKGEWAGLKRTMIVAGVLLVLTLVTLVTAMVTGYRDRAGRAETLQQDMVRIYRDTFPNAETIVDVPLQMQSAVRQLRDKGSLLGDSGAGGPLEILREISAVIDDVPFEVREFVYTGWEVRLAGRTASFDAVNRVAGRLKSSPLVVDAQVAEAKMALEGGQVDFRLVVSLGEEGGRP